MKKISLISGILGAIASMTAFSKSFNPVEAFKRGGTHMRRSRDGASGHRGENRGTKRGYEFYDKHFCRPSNKGGRFDTFAGKPIPRGYPGAKIARKALFGQLTKRH